VLRIPPEHAHHGLREKVEDAVARYDSVVSERAEHHGGTAVAADGQLLSDGDRTPPTGLDSTQPDFHDLEAEVAAEEADE
jgi:hypothetical protein